MIRGIQTKKFRDFRGGRIANENVATMPDTHCWKARNVFFLGDGYARRRNGYTQVLAPANLASKALAGFDFQRQADQKQFVMLNSAGKLSYMNADGTGYANISNAEDAAKIFNFVAGFHSCYCGNGLNMYALIDTGAGNLTKKNWGIAGPAAAPTIANGAGSLTLKYGRQYVYCGVRRWTDINGVARYHIGPPSPISAHTGPLTSKVVTVGAIPGVPADLQITHWWIFGTQDTPLNTTSVFGFMAEIAVGTTSFGDTLLDAQIDLTRLAPWNNFPPPKSEIILQYQNRIAWLVGNTVQLSGADEIDLGVPEETAPAALIFPVPSGTKKLQGGAVIGTDVNAILALSTPDYWFQIRGYSADTLVKRDKVMQPGTVGKKAIATMPSYVVWLGTDKKLWAWDGSSSDPMNLDIKIAQSLTAAQLTLDLMDDTQLANVEVRYFAYGKFQWILVLCSTPGHAGFYDWIQVWDGTQLSRGTTATMMSNVAGNLLSEADMIPSHQISCSWTQFVGNKQFMFFGATDGTIFRFPDGNTDAGTIIADGAISTVPSELDEPDMVKALMFVDVLTNRADAAQGSFTILAGVTDGIIPAVGIPVPVAARPAAYGSDPTVARGSLNQKGTSVGVRAQIEVQFPADALDAWVSGIDVTFRPLHAVDP